VILQCVLELVIILNCQMIFVSNNLLRNMFDFFFKARLLCFTRADYFVNNMIIYIFDDFNLLRDSVKGR
jgi:hypothetical protein